jgi:hypothetical protein
MLVEQSVSRFLSPRTYATNILRPAHFALRPHTGRHRAGKVQEMPWLNAWTHWRVLSCDPRDVHWQSGNRAGRVIKRVSGFRPLSTMPVEIVRQIANRKSRLVEQALKLGPVTPIFEAVAHIWNRAFLVIERSDPCHASWQLAIKSSRQTHLFSFVGSYRGNGSSSLPFKSVLANGSWKNPLHANW